jgi:hypothetical protein
MIIGIRPKELNNIGMKQKPTARLGVILAWSFQTFIATSVDGRI